MAAEETVTSARVYEGKILSLRVDTVRLLNGHTTRREIVEHGEAVAVVPVFANGDVLLVRQFRKPAEQVLLEIPAGGVEPGEEPGDAARRELREETGFTARRLDHLATFYTTPGFSTERMHVYLAAELDTSRLTADEDEDIECVRMTLAQALRATVSDPHSDAKTLIGLLLARDRLWNAGLDR